MSVGPCNVKGSGSASNWSGVSSESVQCNAVREDLASALQAKHPKGFVGVGKLNDPKLKLHIDLEVTVIAHKPRHVHLTIIKVTAKEHTAYVIVQEVDGPMSSITPVVVVLHQGISGCVWLCEKQTRPSFMREYPF